MFANRGGRVLDRALAEARLHELEVREARQAPAAAERQPERELEREQREQRPEVDENARSASEPITPG